MEDDSTKTMSQEKFKIVHIADANQIHPDLGDLAREWCESGEFWSLDSCLNTMNSSSQFLSAAATEKPKVPWIGWYLANVQLNECELLFIYTIKSQRGKGLASVMLMDLIERAKKNSELHAIFLEVRPTNIAATKLYEAHGFSQISRRARYYSNGEDALVYRLNLKN